MYYVFSTITNDTNYCLYTTPEGDKSGKRLPTLEKKVLINGGTGVATKHFVTPLGVVTKVSDEDYEFLMKNESFQRHMKRGFISVRESNVNPEVAAADMVTRDKSSPLVPEDYVDQPGAKPVEGSSKSIKDRFLDRFGG